MYFKDVVKPITSYALQQCQSVGIPFYGAATTNGFFINEKLSEELGELNINQFQITLDGNKEFHDKVKFSHGLVSAFQHVLKNINRLLTNNPSSTVLLRLNYTHDN